MQSAETEAEVQEERRPWAWASLALGTILLVYALLAAALGAYVEQRGAGLDGRPVLWALGAAAPSLVQAGEWWRATPTLFLHPTWWPDLLSSLIVLSTLGPRIERRLGWASLLILFVVSGLAGVWLEIGERVHTPFGAGPALGGLTGAAIVLVLLPGQPLLDRLRGIPALVGAVAIQAAVLHLSRALLPLTWLAGCLTGVALTLALQWSMRTDAGPRLIRSLAFALLALVVASSAWALTGMPQYLILCAVTRGNSQDVQVAAFSQVVKDRPHFLEARIYFVQLLSLGAQMDPMLHQYRIALRLDPEATRSRLRNLADRILARGDRQSQLGNPVAALERYEAAIELAQSPRTLARAHNSFAWTLVAYLDRDYDRALISAQAAGRLAPEDPAILDTLAWTLHRLGRNAEALPIQQRAIERLTVTESDSLPEPVEFTYHLGAILDALGRKDEAAIAYAEALRSQGDHHAARAALRRMNGLTAPGTVEASPPGADPTVRTGVL